MAQKGRSIGMCFGGGYLICTGSLLVMETMKSHPTNENLFIASGVGFALFGLFVLMIHVKRMWKNRPKKDNVVERIEFEVEPVERSVEPKVQMVRLEGRAEFPPKRISSEVRELIIEEKIGDRIEESVEEEREDSFEEETKESKKCSDRTLTLIGELSEEDSEDLDEDSEEAFEIDIM